MSSPLVRVGLDVGGTSIKVGAVDDTGQVLHRDSSPLDGPRDLEEFLDKMTALARGAGVKDELGVGIAGLVDRDAGRVDVSPNLEAIQGVDLRALLAERLGLSEAKVVLENDANTAALGEARQGAAKGIDNVLVVTLGTGIGGGLVTNGELYRGDGGLAGEIGHLVIEPGGHPCGCGSAGCAETLASGRAAERRAHAAGLPAEAPGDVGLLCEKARSGDQDARHLLHEIGRDLGFALAAMITLLDLRTFVIGGGFGAALDLLDTGIRSGIDRRTFGRESKEIHVLPAKLGSDAGWIGAAYLPG